MRGGRQQIGHLPLAHAADNYEMLQHENGNGSQMKCLKIYGYFKLKRKRVFNALLSQTRTHTHTHRDTVAVTQIQPIYFIAPPCHPKTHGKRFPPTKVARSTRQIFFPSCCCFIFCSLVSNQFQCLHAQQQREQQAGNNNNNKDKQPIRWLKSLKI